MLLLLRLTPNMLFSASLRTWHEACYLLYGNSRGGSKSK